MHQHLIYTPQIPSRLHSEKDKRFHRKQSASSRSSNRSQHSPSIGDGNGNGNGNGNSNNLPLPDSDNADKCNKIAEQCIKIQHYIRTPEKVRKLGMEGEFFGRLATEILQGGGDKNNLYGNSSVNLNVAHSRSIMRSRRQPVSSYLGQKQGQIQNPQHFTSFHAQLQLKNHQLNILKSNLTKVQSALSQQQSKRREAQSERGAAKKQVRQMQKKLLQLEGELKKGEKERQYLKKQVQFLQRVAYDEQSRKGHSWRQSILHQKLTQCRVKLKQSASQREEMLIQQLNTVRQSFNTLQASYNSLKLAHETIMFRVHQFQRGLAHKSQLQQLLMQQRCKYKALLLQYSRVKQHLQTVKEKYEAQDAQLSVDMILSEEGQPHEEIHPFQQYRKY